ncbi:hypothetical protein L1887_11234 [Cichorium endivia]|nr:hypothetical protein L1887_11234 [Cichorium endivia]
MAFGCRRLLVAAIVFLGHRHRPSIYRTSTGRRPTTLFLSLYIIAPPSTPPSNAPDDAASTTFPPLGLLHQITLLDVVSFLDFTPCDLHFF